MATQGRYLPDWTIGKLTLEAGNVDFVTTDSLLVTAEIQPGDTIITASGLTLPIAEITGENAGKLAYPCPAAAAGVDQPLRIRYQSEASRYTGMAASLFKMLGGGNLFSLGELQGNEGEYLRFLAPGVLEAVAGGNLEAFRMIELVKNKLLGVNDDGELSMMPVQKAVVFDAAQELTAAARGQVLANIGAGILAGFRNQIINGDFFFWQRGNSFAAPGQYFADRWCVTFGVGGTVTCDATKQTFAAGQADVPGEPQFFARVNFSSVTGGAVPQVFQRIEEVRTLAGKRATVTAYLRASVTGKNARISLAQNFGAGGSARVEAGNRKIALSTQWQRVDLIVDVPNIAGKTLGLNHFVELLIEGEASTPLQLDIARVSLVEGDATAEKDPFASRHLQQELALCQRYFQTFATGSSWFGGTTCYGDRHLRHDFNLPTRMRVPPSITRVNLAGSIFWNGSWLDVTVIMQALNDFTVQVIFDVPGWMATPESPGILSRLTNINETQPVIFQLASEY